MSLGKVLRHDGDGVSSSVSAFWRKKSNQREFLEEIGKKLGIKKAEDWYRIHPKQIANFGADNILQLYNNSFVSALINLFPEKRLQFWRFPKRLLQSGFTVPKSYWDDQSLQRAFFDHVMDKELRLRNMDDWYNVNPDSLNSFAKKLIQAHHQSSFQRALTKIYPEYGWKSPNFKETRAGRNYWGEVSAQRQLFEEIGRKLRIKHFTDWYNVTLKEIIQHGGGTVVIGHYKSSHIQALMKLYPEYPWDPLRFQVVRRNTWKSEANRKEFMDNIGKKLGVEHWEDWYKFVQRDVLNQSRGAYSVLRNHGYSLFQTLKDLYPEHPWKAYKFPSSVRNFWNKEENIQEVLKELETELKIIDPRDWFRISSVQLVNMGMGTLLTKAGGIQKLLINRIFSKGPVNGSLMDISTRFPKKMQYLLFLHVQEMFPKEDILIEYPHPDLRYKTGKLIELDIYIPSRNVALEYHGKQHYERLSHIRSDLELRKSMDEERRLACIEAGITLFEIPYTWDGTSSSLHNYMKQSNALEPPDANKE